MHGYRNHHQPLGGGGEGINFAWVGTPSGTPSRTLLGLFLVSRISQVLKYFTLSNHSPRQVAITGKWTCSSFKT